jgi:hypothetical protein
MDSVNEDMNKPPIRWKILPDFGRTVKRLNVRKFTVAYDDVYFLPLWQTAPNMQESGRMEQCMVMAFIQRYAIQAASIFFLNNGQSLKQN